MPMTNAVLWTNPAAVMQGELSADEKLLWSGQPRSGIRLRATDVFLIPFSLLWCGFAIFWETMVISSGAPLFMKLWGIPFVAIGIFFVVGRFMWDAKTRQNTYYGVTNERVIIVNGLFARRTKSLNLRTLSDISLTERSDGSGTITFGPQHPMGYWFPAGSWPGAGQFAPPAFDLIEQAKPVYEIIRQAQRAT